ncbi:small acidic protein-like [Asterias rubens]|uniref:small acidic protein-like n=1 Tax=Asterias rubens TaxID=7604 RepID=UPI001455C440|nr:small acidic protein-like [Asterias rubens]
MSDGDRGNGQERGKEPAVHSANKWESANFGDDDQKQKFLRLMGGMKKQHTGRFVIGDSTQEKTHSRTEDETKKIEETLQSQYKVGLQAKISGQNKRHVGLGFAEPEPTKEEKPKGMHKRFSDSGEESDEDQDKKEDSKEEKRSEDKQDRERKEYRDERRRDERRRDDRARERSSDEGSSSREKHRSHRHRDRDEKSSSREDDKKCYRDDESRETKERRKHRQEEESEEMSERKRKKHKDNRHSSDSD